MAWPTRRYPRPRPVTRPPRHRQDGYLEKEHSLIEDGRLEEMEDEALRAAMRRSLDDSCFEVFGFAWAGVVRF